MYSRLMPALVMSLRVVSAPALYVDGRALPQPALGTAGFPRGYPPELPAVPVVPPVAVPVVPPVALPVEPPVAAPVVPPVALPVVPPVAVPVVPPVAVPVAPPVVLAVLPP